MGSKYQTNENATENLKLALKIYDIGQKLYPGFFRPLYLRDAVFNQNLNSPSILIEIGATGNTIEQANNATRVIANILSEL